MRLRGRPYIHTCRSYAWPERTPAPPAPWRTGQPCCRRRGRFVRFWTSGGAKFPKIGHFLARTPVNHSAKFDAASFVLGEEILNRTNTQTNKNRQTVTALSTPCLSACMWLSHILCRNFYCGPHTAVIKDAETVTALTLPWDWSVEFRSNLFWRYE